MFALMLELRLDDDFMSKVKCVYLEGDKLPRSGDQYFSMLGDQHFNVFMQTKGEFWWPRWGRSMQLCLRCVAVNRSYLIYTHAGVVCQLMSPQSHSSLCFFGGVRGRPAAGPGRTGQPTTYRFGDT